jgi:hypothetical protein
MPKKDVLDDHSKDIDDGIGLKLQINEFAKLIGAVGEPVSVGPTANSRAIKRSIFPSSTFSYGSGSLFQMRRTNTTGRDASGTYYLQPKQSEFLRRCISVNGCFVRFSIPARPDGSFLRIVFVVVAFLQFTRFPDPVSQDAWYHFSMGLNFAFESGSRLSVLRDYAFAHCR